MDELNHEERKIVINALLESLAEKARDNECGAILADLAWALGCVYGNREHLIPDYIALEVHDVLVQKQLIILGDYPFEVFHKLMEKVKQPQPKAVMED